MPDPPPTPTPAPARARPALLAGGLALVVAGVAVLAWALASAAGLVGGSDNPAMDDTPRTLELQGGTPATTGGAGAPTVAYRLEPAGGRPVTVRLEVAADPASRARGLMGRRKLPQGTGMVFLYPADVTEAYWMKDTLVALSIAFVAADGRVVSVAERTPAPAGRRPGRTATRSSWPAGPSAPPGSGRGPRWSPSTPTPCPNRRKLPAQQQDKSAEATCLTIPYSTPYLVRQRPVHSLFEVMRWPRP
jgi:uncharacterized membrane protein (UPF0127 family)